MKIIFDDQSYCQCELSGNPGKVIITIGAKSADDPLKKIVNSVEISLEQLKELISDIK
jgi:hypothetical protein